MIAMPAIDLREGACVQLVGGSYAEERVRVPDPVAAARGWMARGFRQIHVVDLDAALGVGSNAGIVGDLLALGDGVCQVGGGVRSPERVDALLRAGASRVVVGTRALESVDWLAAQCERWPGRIVLALDVRAGVATTHGWTRAVPRRTPETVLREVSPLPLAAILVTAVDVEGSMRGYDRDLVERVRTLTTVPLVASGGVATMDDLRALAGLGVWGVVIGMALYTGALRAEQVAEEFNA